MIELDRIAAAKRGYQGATSVPPNVLRCSIENKRAMAMQFARMHDDTALALRISSREIDIVAFELKVYGMKVIIEHIPDTEFSVARE